MKDIIKFEELEFELDERGVAKITIYKNTGNTLFYYKDILIHFDEIRLVIFEVLEKLNYYLNLSLNENSIATLAIDSKIGIKLHPTFLGNDIAFIKHSELSSADIC